MALLIQLESKTPRNESRHGRRKACSFSKSWPSFVICRKQVLLRLEVWEVAMGVVTEGLALSFLLQLGSHFVPRLHLGPRDGPGWGSCWACLPGWAHAPVDPGWLPDITTSCFQKQCVAVRQRRTWLGQMEVTRPQGQWWRVFCTQAPCRAPGGGPSSEPSPLTLRNTLLPLSHPPQPHSSLSHYPIYVVCLSESTAIITQRISTEDSLEPRHYSRSVTLMNWFCSQTIHFTDGEVEAQRIKSTGPNSCSLEVEWSGSEGSQFAPIPPSAPTASQGCSVAAHRRAQ